MGPYWNPELETKPWPEVLRWQEGRVAAMLPALRARSRLYAGKLAGAGDELPGLPLTTKDELRRAQERAAPGAPLGEQQAVALGDVVQVVSSSGTTGRPVYYGLTEADLRRWSDGIANSFFTAGIRPEDVVAHLVALPMVAGGLPYADGLRRIGATLAWLGGFPLERILASLRGLGASALLSTTSFALHLTERGEDVMGAPVSSLGVRKLLGGGEPGLGQPEIRERITRGWRTDHVRETMGLGDVLASMWAECDEGGGMHFNGQAYVHVGLVDPATLEPVPWVDGAGGEAVYTTFERDATPVVRFRSSDHMLVTATSCGCGRTSPRVRCVGRTDDMLIYKGMNVFPTAIRDVVLTRFADVVEPHLRIWKDSPAQVTYETAIPVEVEARGEVPAERYGEIAARIVDLTRQHLQVRLDVRLVAPGSLPRAVYKTALVQVRDAD